MDCVRDLEFHDDNSRALEKAKESILLIKKKMFLSNDLIVQYNNKLKECERLKGDLYLAQEEVAKLKRDNNANLSKVVRLEMQSTDNKKARQELEQKIAERDIQTASDKSHLQQLACKLEAAEAQHTEKFMEFELDKSALEVKVKELEQELKASKRSHQTEINKLERALKSPKEKKGKKIVEVAKETREIGVNTVEEAKQPRLVKPPTAEKSVLTNDFYHIRDDPYPLFCHKCESSVQPRVEKICEIMAHPPLVGNMLSPVRPRERQQTAHNDSNNLDSNRFNVDPRDSHLNSSFRAEETNLKNTNRVKSNPKELSHVDPFSRNSVCTTSQLPVNSFVCEVQATPVDATVPELIDLRRKVATLERKIKKQKTQKSSDIPPPGASCCSHPHSVNCCGHSSSHVNPVANVFPNTQADLMTEFFNRMMNLAGQRDQQQKPSKVDSRRRQRNSRDKRAKMKLRKLKRMKILKKNNPSNWNVESDECEAEKTAETPDPSDPTKPHLLRIKPSRVNSPVDTESEKSSAEEDSWEASFAEASANPPENAEKIAEKRNRFADDSNRKSAVKVPDKTRKSTRGCKTAKSSLFGDDDDDSETNVEFVKNAVAEETHVNRRKNVTTCPRIRSRSFRAEETERQSFEAEKTERQSFQAEKIERQSFQAEKTERQSLAAEKSVSEQQNPGNSCSESTNGVSVSKQRNSGNSSMESTIDESVSKQQIPEDSSGQSAIGETVLKQQNPGNSCRESTIDESVSKQQNPEDSNGQSTIKESISDEQNPENSFKQSMIDESGSDLPASSFDNTVADQSDAQLAMNSDSEPSESTSLQVRVELRKRKRSGSPRATKRAGRTNLLGKLRALKKSSVASVACNLSAIHATRSLSRRKLTEPSETEDVEANSSFSQDETNPCVPIKKQRIAHVPKAAGHDEQQKIPARSNTSDVKSSELSEKMCEDASVKVEEKHATAATKRPRTRRSTVEKLSKSELKKEPDSSESGRVDGVGSAVEKLATGELTSKPEGSQSGNVGRLGLPAGVAAAAAVLPRRRGRPPGRKNAATIARLNLQLQEAALAKSLANKVSPEEAVAASASSNKIHKNPSDGAESPENSLQKNRDDVNSVEVSEPVEKDRASNVLAADSTVVLNGAKGSSTLTLFSTDGASVLFVGTADKSEVVPPAEKAKSPPDASAASPAASPEDSSASPAAPLDASSAKPAEVSTSPNRSAVSSGATTIENNKLSENSHSPGNSIRTDKTESPAPGATVPTAMTSLPTSPENFNETEQNADKFEASKIPSSADSASETILPIPDDSPASPDASPLSPDATLQTNTEILTSKPAERLSIYDNVELPPLEKTAAPTPLNYFSPVEDARSPFFQDTSLPIVKPIERNLPDCDTDLHDDDESDDEDSDTNKFVKPQFFVETSVVEKKRARKSRVLVTPTKVVKELRSRQVLSSPSTSADCENAQKAPNAPHDEAKTLVSSEATVSHPVGRFEGSSLETLLNLHLHVDRQNRKSVTVYTNLQRAGAMKLQAAAENNVRAELERLVKAEEWTTELHRSVMTRILEIRSERTVAKSIVDFLVARSSLDEPLDKTHTPPAPIMTTTQQRIVTLINCLQREEAMRGIFDVVQAGIEHAIFNSGAVQQMPMVEYMVRIFTVIARIRKDRERVRIMCCDAFYMLGRKALPAIHVILTVWPEVLPKHGTSESEVPNCLVHMIKQEPPGNNPFPKIIALKKMITNYYDYPKSQATSTVVMTVLMKALHENYSSDLETAILLISKREGTKWALDNVIEKGLMTIIRDDNYEWEFEVLRLFGFILRTFPFSSPDVSVQKYVDLLCQMLDTGEGSRDKQEGLVSALLSLSRYTLLFSKISDSVLKWKPSGDMRASTLEQLNSFFKSHTPTWWKKRQQLKMKNKKGKANG